MPNLIGDSMYAFFLLLNTVFHNEKEKQKTLNKVSNSEKLEKKISQ